MAEETTEEIVGQGAIWRYNLNPEDRAALAELLRRIVKRPVTGEVTICLGQGGIGAVRLDERKRATE